MRSDHNCHLNLPSNDSPVLYSKGKKAITLSKFPPPHVYGDTAKSCPDCKIRGYTPLLQYGRHFLRQAETKEAAKAGRIVFTARQFNLSPSAGGQSL